MSTSKSPEFILLKSGLPNSIRTVFKLVSLTVLVFLAGIMLMDPAIHLYLDISSSDIAWPLRQPTRFDL